MKLSSLPSTTRQLILIMQDLRFGRIENLPVENGQPRVEACRSIRKRKLVAGNTVPAVFPDDFDLKRQHLELIQFLRSTSNGTISSIDVRHGLPCLVEEVASVTLNS